MVKEQFVPRLIIFYKYGNRGTSQKLYFYTEIEVVTIKSDLLHTVPLVPRLVPWYLDFRRPNKKVLNPVMIDLLFRITKSHE